MNHEQDEFEQLVRELEETFAKPNPPKVPDFLLKYKEPSPGFVPTEQEIDYKERMKAIAADESMKAYAILPQWPQYKFNEDKIINEAFEYINSTYDGHYADEKTGIQTMDFIMSNSESCDFLKGNVLKYVARYGKKEGYNKKDIFKAIHYLILLYHFSQDK